MNRSQQVPGKGTRAIILEKLLLDRYAIKCQILISLCYSKVNNCYLTVLLKYTWDSTKLEVSNYGFANVIKNNSQIYVMCSMISLNHTHSLVYHQIRGQNMGRGQVHRGIHNAR